ncbi:hypothetical protein BRADI_4g24213v3, partial [Brachypodium distachyon]
LCLSFWFFGLFPLTSLRFCLLGELSREKGWGVGWRGDFDLLRRRQGDSRRLFLNSSLKKGWGVRGGGGERRF